MESMAPKIKICGLTRPEDIEAVNQLLPDYIGFGSGRRVGGISSLRRQRN